MNRKTWIYILVALSLLAISFAAYYIVLEKRGVSTGRDSSSMPEDTELITLADLDIRLLELDGVTKLISDFSEGILFLNFWATWCGYCEKEMPDLIKLDDMLKQNGEGRVVAVDVNEKEAVVKSYLSKMGFDGLIVLLDQKGDAALKFGIEGYPTTFVFKDGALVDYKVGMLTWENMLALYETARTFN